MQELLGKASKASKAFEARHGREPTAEELAPELGVDPSRIKDAWEAVTNPRSLDQPMGDADGGTLGDVVEVGGMAGLPSCAGCATVCSSARSTAWTLFILHAVLICIHVLGRQRADSTGVLTCVVCVSAPVLLFPLQDERTIGSEEAVYIESLKKDLEGVLAGLSDRDAGVLRMRFGLVDGREYTLDEVGAEFKVRVGRMHWGGRIDSPSCPAVAPAVAALRRCVCAGA